MQIRVKRGTKRKNEFTIEKNSIVIGNLLKSERKKANLTQEQLANNVGAKKSYISRVENGKTDIQLSTLFRLFEIGLGKEISIKLN